MGLVVVVSNYCSAQGFLHRDGKKIVDGNGTNFIIKSIGTGNWMLQEGYMMQTSGIANTQWEFRKKLRETIGETKTDSFYNVWLKHHFTRADVDSMKAWGFNSIRPALHYKWFTLPIEEETLAGENTWLNKGFEMTDSLIKWCADNEMYLFLDMHGAPGGQGANADISDYDPSKPSLWESQANKDKLIALWKKLAERYSNEPWIGGYDLLNEPNWDLGNGHQPLWNLYKDVTEAIREVDENHIIILEGNWFANDYAGLPTLWDDNIVLSFHKYWTYNHEHSIDWMLNLQNERNVPLWLGESGENSNTWFTNLIALCEKNNVGWSWWPVKKAGINNILQVELNSDYQKLINYWKGEGPSLSEEEAFQAVLTFAKNHKIENCTIKYDVIDAMIRQPSTIETKPFKSHAIEEKVFCVDFDYGRNNCAYFDSDTANYSLESGGFTAWNTGWSYRNDGVDIESSTDTFSDNDYQVGWTVAGEWLQYTIENEAEAAYSVDLRSASESSGSKLHFEVNGEAVSKDIMLPKTNSWSNWTTTTAENIILPEGTVKLRIFIDQAGSNLNYFELKNPIAPDAIPFNVLSAQTTENHRIIKVTLNKDITVIDKELAKTEFTLFINDVETSILKLDKSESSNRIVTLYVGTDLLYSQKIELSYSGTNIQSGSQNLESFSKETVKNNLEIHLDVPSKIEAEDFTVNSGFEIEDCEDFGGGYNMAFSNAGDYLDYNIYIENTGLYKLDYRLATSANNSTIIMKVGSEINLFPIDTLVINNTGGWQTWKTQSSEVKLNKGVQTLRLWVKNGEFNINWFKFNFITSIKTNQKTEQGYLLYPNPAKGYSIIDFKNSTESEKSINIYDLSSRLILSQKITASEYLIDTTGYPKGIYIIQVNEGSNNYIEKLIVQ